MTRYTVTMTATGRRYVFLTDTAEVAATRARDAELAYRRSLAPGRRIGEPLEAVAINDADPTDTATVRFGR